MFRFVVEDAKKFKLAIDSIVNLIDEGELEFSSKEISLRAIDPSQISMVLFSMPKESFVEYEVIDPIKVGINFDNLSKILARSKSGEKLEIYKEENKIIVKFSSGKKRRSFKIPILDMPSPLSKVPNTTPNVVVKMLGSNFRDQIKDATLVSSHITLNASSEGFKINVYGDSSDLLVEQEKDSEEIISFVCEEDSKATFPLQYLDDITKACPDSNPMTISFESNKPIKIEYEVQGAKLVYFLAPRVESD